jgi:hypothetical protein
LKDFMLLFASRFFPETASVGRFTRPKCKQKRPLAVTGVLETGSRSTTCRPNANLYSVLKTFPLLSFDSSALLVDAGIVLHCCLRRCYRRRPQAQHCCQAHRAAVASRESPQPSSSAQEYQESSASLERSHLPLRGRRRHFGPPAASHGGPIHLASSQL